MMVKHMTKTGWACSDGTFFEDKAEAEKHELRIELRSIVTRFHTYDMRVSDIVDGLVENIDRIKGALR